MNSEDKIIELLKKQSEGVKLESFKDPDGLMCIGINLVQYYPNGAIIREHDTCTEQQALDWTKKKLFKKVYPDVEDFCRRHRVRNEIYESMCVFAYNEGSQCIKTVPFIVCLVNKRWYDLARIMIGNIHYKDPFYYSENQLRKRRIEIDNFKHLDERIEHDFLS